MPTELKIRRVRSITVSGVQSGSHSDGKFARVLTVRSEDGHIYNITLVSDQAEWLDLEANGAKRGRRGPNGGKDARYAGALNSEKKFFVVAAASSSDATSRRRATSSAT